MVYSCFGFNFNVILELIITISPFIPSFRVRRPETSELHLKMRFWCIQWKWHHLSRHDFRHLMAKYSKLSHITETAINNSLRYQILGRVFKPLRFWIIANWRSTTRSTTQPFKGLTWVSSYRVTLLECLRHNHLSLRQVLMMWRHKPDPLLFVVCSQTWCAVLSHCFTDYTCAQKVRSLFKASGSRNQSQNTRINYEFN